MRIHSSLTAAREAFVLSLLMQTPDLNFQSVNDTLASEDHKDLWGKGKDGEQKPLMMAFKRIAEIREHAKLTNEHVKNGLQAPPLPLSTLKKVKTAKTEAVVEAKTDSDTVIVTSEPAAEVLVELSTANDNASEAVEVAAAAV